MGLPLALGVTLGLFGAKKKKISVKLEEWITLMSRRRHILLRED